MMRTVALFIFGTPLARLFDLNGEVNRVRKKHNRAIIAADVRRFGHVINKDGVLSTHRGYAAPDVINFAQLSPCDGFIFLSQPRSCIETIEWRKMLCRRKLRNTTRRHQNISPTPPATTGKRPSITRPEITRRRHTMLIQRGPM